VLHQIGAGTLGPVFRASGSEGDRPVAIKVFKLDLPPQRVHQLVAQFERLIAARLSRPGIALPIATGIEGNSAYLAQEFVAADSLDVIVRDYGAAEPSDAVRVAAQLAAVLDFAAIAGVGHGALHPRDVLISQGETWMTGLGVEQALRLVGGSTPIRPPYTAPERLAGAAWDRRVDIFSLAGLIHDLLWSRRMTGLGEQVAASLRPLPGGDPEGLWRTFSRALAKNPADRFGTAAEFATALREAFPGIREAPQLRTTVDNEQPASSDDVARALPVSVVALAPSEALTPSRESASWDFDDKAKSASAESLGEAAEAPELASLRPLAVQAAVETLPSPQVDDVPSESGRSEDVNAAPAFAAPIAEELAMFAEERPAADREVSGAPQQASDRLDASVEPGRSAEDFPPPLASNAGEPRQASLEHEERETGGLLEEKQPPSRRDEVFEDISFPERRPQPEYAPAPGLTPMPVPPSEAEPAHSAIWPLALTLVVGLGVGFASGYFLGSGDRITSVSADRIAASSPSPTTPPVAASPLTSTASAAPASPESAAREFTEGAVSAPPAVKVPTPPAQEKTSSLPQSPRPAPRTSARTSAPPSRQVAAESSAGRLLVRTTPAGARVLVDGKDSGASPATVHDLARGSHRVRVIREGFEPEERRIFITSSQPAQSLTIALSPLGSADSTPQATSGQFQGQLSVDSRPIGAKVFLDGKLVGTTPMMLPQIAAGEHVVRLDNDGYRRWSSLVRVVAGERNRVTASLEK
jgi:serine/threonine protein kinase